MSSDIRCAECLQAIVGDELELLHLRDDAQYVHGRCCTQCYVVTHIGKERSPHA